MCQTRENRWSGIMAITATYPGANGKNKTWMTSFPLYYNPKAHQSHSVKTGLVLSKKSIKLTLFDVRKCLGTMKILFFIEDPEVIKKILKHLDLWDLKARPPPKRAKAPPPTADLEDSARPGATRLPVAAQTMHYSKRDFVRTQCW